MENLITYQYSAFFIGVFVGWLVFILSIYCLNFFNKKMESHGVS